MINTRTSENEQKNRFQSVKQLKVKNLPKSGQNSHGLPKRILPIFPSDSHHHRPIPWPRGAPGAARAAAAVAGAGGAPGGAQAAAAAGGRGGAEARQLGSWRFRWADLG